MQGLGVVLESATVAGRHLAERNLKPVFGLDKAVEIKAHFALYPARRAKRPTRICTLPPSSGTSLPRAARRRKNT